MVGVVVWVIGASFRLSHHHFDVSGPGVAAADGALVDRSYRWLDEVDSVWQSEELHIRAHSAARLGLRRPLRERVLTPRQVGVCERHAAAYPGRNRSQRWR